MATCTDQRSNDGFGLFCSSSFCVFLSESCFYFRHHDVLTVGSALLPSICPWHGLHVVSIKGTGVKSLAGVTSVSLLAGKSRYSKYYRYVIRVDL